MENRTFILFDDLADLPPPTSRAPAAHLARLVAQTLPPVETIEELSPDDVVLEEDDVDAAW